MLVDTSVWVEHLRHGYAALASNLDEGEVWTHPFVIGEISCGYLRHRAEVLALLQALPLAEIADHDEVLRFVEAASLAGAGIGWVDAHLLAASRLAGISLWTLDRRLGSAARRLRLTADV